MKINSRLKLYFTMIVIIPSFIMSGCYFSKTVSLDVNTLTIRQDKMLNHIEELISEKYKGRLTGTDGNYLATQYIASYFKKIGLKNPEGIENYMQCYTQPAIIFEKEPLLQLIDKDGTIAGNFDYGEDFVLRRLSSSSSQIDIKALMYLPESENMLTKDNMDLKDKILLIPKDMSWMAGSTEAPLDLAYKYGAAAVICEFDLADNQTGLTHLKVTPMMNYWITNDFRPFAYVDSKTFLKLKDARKSNKQLYFSCHTNSCTKTKAANIIGFIQGSDPKLKDEYIIIGSHFDHVGDNMNGTYNPGALDNASGPAAMMEVARILTENNSAPRKSIVFIAFNGESSGQLGSKYYTEHPPFPMDKAVMINLDMVGSSAKIPLLIASSKNHRDDKTQALCNAFEVHAKSLAIDYRIGSESGSDHSSFTEKGVPAVLLTHPDFKNGYHSPYDRIDKVNGDRLAEVVKLVLLYIKSQAYSTDKSFS